MWLKGGLKDEEPYWQAGGMWLHSVLASNVCAVAQPSWQAMHVDAHMTFLPLVGATPIPVNFSFAFKIFKPLKRLLRLRL